MKKKNITLIGLIILGIVFVIIGSTFAYIIWNSNDSQKTDVVFTVESNFSCSANVGGYISSSDAHIKPTTVSDKTVGNYIKREVKVKPTISLMNDGISMELWLNINELGEELSKSDNFMYTLTTSSTSNMEGVVVSGNFKDKQVGDKIILIDKKEYSESTTETYYLWIWLDSMETNIATAGQTFNLSLGGVCSEIDRTYANLGGENELFKADEYREKITKIEFVEGINIPEGAITFELGESPSKTTDVMGWLISNGTDTYTLKIGANDKIYAHSLAYAFYNMTALKEISFNNLDTSITTDMFRMFCFCSGLTSLDLSSFNTSKVINMYDLFASCSGLVNINLSSFDTSNVTNMRGMFYQCSSLTALDLSNFDTSKVVNMYRMFYNNASLTSLDIGSFNTSNVTNMNGMFYSCSGLTKIYVGSFNTQNVVDMASMFDHCSGLTTLDLSNFDTSNVQTMKFMFDTCSGLKSLNISSFNTSKVTSMYRIFAGCSNLTSLNLSSFDTSNVTNMRSMFNSLSNLTSLDISNFDTSKVTTTAWMFQSCTKLTSLNLSGFNTSKIEDMEGTFYGCSNLTNIYVSSKWNTSLVTKSTNMFNGCVKLPNFNSSVVDKTNAHYNTGGYLTYKAV